MIDWMVGAVTLIAAAVSIWWFVSPEFRNAVERPKFRMLETEKRFRRQ